jgi:KipI family sensor histidine kinase inhibitor
VIRPFGESALLVDTGSAAEAQALASVLRGHPRLGVTGIVPGLGSVLIELGPDADPDVAARAVESVLRDLPESPPVAGRLHEIAVRYGGDAGPDLVSVADATGLTPHDVVDLHTSLELGVLFCGFAPGFAYLGNLPDAIRVPRLATPRTRTPAGSVAIAGPMTGIYPADLPGGWPVIGRTDVTVFDPHGDPPALLVPGDRVRFVRAAPG